MRPAPNGGMLRSGTHGRPGVGGRPANWLKPRMAAALRSGKAAEMIRDVIAGKVDGARVADRISAVETAAKLADLVPERGASLTVTVEQETGEERLQRVLGALPGLLASLPVEQRMQLSQAVARAAGEVSGSLT